MSKAVSNKKHKKSLKRAAKNKKEKQMSSQLMNGNTVKKKRLGGVITYRSPDELSALTRLAQGLTPSDLGIPPEFVLRSGDIAELKDGRSVMLMADVPNPLHLKPIEQSKRPDSNLKSVDSNKGIQSEYAQTVGVRMLNQERWNELFAVHDKIVINNTQLLWLATDSMIDVSTAQRRNRSIDPAVLSQYLKQDDEAQHEITERYSHEFVNLTHSDRHIRIKIKLDVMDGSPYSDEITLDVMPQIVEALEPIQQYQLDTGDEFTKPLCETFKPDGLGYEIWRNFVLDREDYVEIAEGLVA